MNDSPLGLSPKEEHERVWQLWGGYTAFIAALLIATMATSGDYPHARPIISFLAISLPSLVAYMFLDFTVRVKQRRIGSMFRGLAIVLGLVPSLVGITMVIGHFSLIAGVLWVLLAVFWFLVLDVVTFLGARPGSTI
jgi:hypothetical protein